MQASPTLTLDQEQALYHLEKGRQNLFITGGAGTGKSFLLRHFLNQQKEKIPVLASTGAAAILIGGRTFHSFFGLGIMQGGAEATIAKALDNKRLRKRMNSVETIIIDEISMLSFNTLDCAEKIARGLRGNPLRPWGGLRIIAVGDFCQLPPVSRNRGSKEWAFLGEAWAASDFKRIDLKEVMRTSDHEFLQVLQDLRVGALTRRLENFFDDRIREEMDTDVTHLFARRDQTEKYNLMKLFEIELDPRKYETIYGGDERYHDQLRRDAPIPPVLELKKGAMVMIRMNDPKQRYVNGSVGRVWELQDERIYIDLKDRRVEIEPFAFSVQDADGKEVAYAKNFPLNLAYASTIHKIQGSTLDKIHIDLAGLWEPGHAYVAVSRAKRAEDVSFIRWSPTSIRSDPMVKSFYGLAPAPEPSREVERMGEWSEGY